MHSISLEFIKMYLTDKVNINTGYMQLYLTVGLIVVSCFMIDFGAKLIRRILSPMKEGRPFEADFPANLKKMAWVILFGGAIVQIIGIVERIILIRACPIEDFVLLCFYLIFSLMDRFFRKNPMKHCKEGNVCLLFYD